MEEGGKRRKKEGGGRREEKEGGSGRGRRKGWREGGHSILSSFAYKDTVPSWGFTLMTSCQPNYLPKISYPNTAILAVRVSTHEFCGHISIQSTAHY